LAMQEARLEIPRSLAAYKIQDEQLYHHLAA
jgi:hypothetical protein